MKVRLQTRRRMTLTEALLNDFAAWVAKNLRRNQA